MRIRYQLAAAIFLTGLVGVTALVVDRVIAVRELLHGRAETRAHAIAESIEPLILPDLAAGNQRHVDRVAKSFARLPGVAYVRVYGRDGKLVAHQGRRTAAKTGLIESHTATLDPSTGEVVGGVQVAISTAGSADSVSTIAWRGFAVGLASVFVLAIVAWYAGIRLGRRLEELDKAVGRVDTGEPLAVDDSGTDSEVDRLARHFRALHERMLSEKAKRIKLESFKDDLTNMVVHDMKHPITVLAATIALLTEPERNQIGAEKLASLSLMSKRAISRENAMIEQLLQLARLKNAELPLQRKRLPLRAFIKECAEANAVVVEQFQMRWKLEVADDVADAWVYGDPAVLKRLIGNLVLNALEHSPAGGLVTLSAKLCDGDRSKAEIIVRDQGLGVPPALREGLFEARITTSESPKNAGLGLAFCRMAAQRHSARLKLIDAGGPGAAVALVIPVFGKATPSGRRGFHKGMDPAR